MVHPEHEERLAIGGSFSIFATALAGRELVSSEGVLGPEIPGTDSVSSTKQSRRFLRGQRGQHAAKFLSLQRFAKSDADVAGQRIIPSKTFVGALQYDDVLLALERTDDRCLGKRTDDVDVNRSDLGVALLSEVIASFLDVFGRAAQRDENRVRIPRFVFGHEAVMAAGQSSE